MREFLKMPITQGAIAGFVAAAAVDYHAFRGFKSESEFVSYDWRTAALRWSQGVLGGALTAYGLGAV